MRIFGSNYQKKLTPVSLKMRGARIFSTRYIFLIFFVFLFKKVAPYVQDVRLLIHIHLKSHYHLQEVNYHLH